MKKDLKDTIWISKNGDSNKLLELDKKHLENILKVMKKVSVEKKIPMKDVRLGKNQNVNYLDIKLAIKQNTNITTTTTEDEPNDFMDMIEL